MCLKNKIIDFILYNPLTKLLLKIRITDLLLRSIFKKFFTKKLYYATEKEGLTINNELYPLLKKYSGCLGHGAALSLIRDSKWVDDQDLDYDIFSCDNCEEFIKDLKKLHFKVLKIGFLGNVVKQIVAIKDGVIVDFFICDVTNEIYEIGTICRNFINFKYEKKDNVYIYYGFIMYLRKMHKTSIEEKTVLNNKFLLPKNFDTYFTDIYGNDWRKPNKFYNWGINPKNNKPKIIKKDVIVKSFEKLNS